MAVKFVDNSIEVKGALNDESLAWLRTWASEIASQAKDSTKLDGDAGSQLRKDYRSDIDEAHGKALIGSTLEAAYWEEFGTGSYADTGKNGGIPGRQGWWVYVKDQERREKKSKTYSSEAEAMETVMYLRSLGLDAYATKGREPNYTLETAFTKTKSKAIADFENRLERRMK